MDQCARHPSQLFTGFCASCLAERLSAVDSPSKSAPRAEIVELPSSSSSSALDSSKRCTEIKARITLLSLFQLEDSTASSAAANCGDSKTHLSDGSADGSSNNRGKNPSFRSSSGMPLRGFRWGSRCGSKSGRFADKELENKPDIGQSSDWEKPRHSWDGSMMSKALACPFACLEEPLEGSRRISRCIGSLDGVQVEQREKPASPHSSRETHLVKKSHRWSRVWDWSITSPFRDFGKKKERNLERSSSVSCWQDSRKERNGIGLNGNANVNGISSGRNTNGINGGEIQKYRPESQRRREYRFGRSRSVHYPSPGNVDNGLLRFYLTPMRSSVRSSSRGSLRSSRFFPKGFIGR